MGSERLAGFGAMRMRSAAAQRQSALYVCPLSRVHETIERTGARRLVTLINQQTMLETPPGIAPTHHLRIAVNDISEPQEGLVHPCEAHVEEIIRFAGAWGREGHLVVHCWAGISRSTAAAFITLCTLNPEAPESLVALQLRKASLTATPNRLLVRLADDMLGRGGRMVSAVEEIGFGEPASEALPFSLPASFV